MATKSVATHSHLVAVAGHESRGKILVATQTVPRATEMLREDPLLILTSETKAFPKLPPQQLESIDPTVWFAYMKFLRLPPAAQKEFLGLFYVADCDKVKVLRQELERINAKTILDTETFISVFAVMEFNSMGFINGSGIYSTAARAAHSCIPNCSWGFESDQLIFRSIVPIKEGEELTISYKPDDVYRAISIRRNYLMRSKCFRCECPRCSSEFDDTRYFTCMNTRKCVGFYRVQMLPNDLIDLTECSVCGVFASEIQKKKIFNDEQELVTQLQEYEGAVEPDVFARLSRMKPLHPHHFTTYMYLRHIQSFSRALTMPIDSMRVQFAATKLATLRAILKFPNKQFASACLDHGSALLLSNNPNILDAQVAFREGVRVFAITNGTGHKFSINAVNMLLKAQQELKWEDIILPHEQCCLCGSNENLKLCSRCRQVSYCCVEHQRAQWPLHKPHCNITGNA